MLDRSTLVAFLLSASLAGPACGRHAPTAPSPPPSPFIGSWSGTIADDNGAAGRVEITITRQMAISLLGTWQATFQDHEMDDGGPAAGSVDGNRVAMTLTSARARDCAPTVPGTMVIGANLVIDGDAMSGPFFALGCGPLRGGHLVLTKR